jgi:hypothetical protein
MQPVVMNHYVRGAVSGLGLVNLAYALAEIAAVVAGRGSGPTTTTGDA